MKTTGKQSTGLKGIVHEIMFRDKQNLCQACRGVKTSLSRSPKAVRDDIVRIKGRRVVGRFQLKDTPCSIDRTIEQVRAGKYHRTRLMGTKETVKAYAEKAAQSGVPQKMTSTGISSEGTERVASKVTGSAQVGCKALARSAAKVGGFVGLCSAGLEGLMSAPQLVRGEITAMEYVGRVAKQGATGWATGAASEVAGTVAIEIATTVLASASAPVWVPVAVGTAVAVGAGIAVKKVSDCVYDNAAKIVDNAAWGSRLQFDSC